MKRKNLGRVLAIGLDAAEPTFIRELIEAGELPVLKSLLERGSWSAVASPARIGSGTVWPTFFTGREPTEHAIHSDWCWQPETMSLVRYDSRSVTPFWKRLNEEGVRVGVLDVPFAPLVGLTEGFEISEWGAHDTLEGRMRFAPEKLSTLLNRESTPHPFSLEGYDGVCDLEALKRLSRACLSGAHLRGDFAVRLIEETAPQLSIIVFPEIHHAAHKLWHTVATDHPVYTEREKALTQGFEPTMREIVREVDRQIGRLIEAAGDDATVMVFSLHGMSPARGLPAFLESLLCASAHARLSGWASQSWRERTLTLFAAAKRHTPNGLKKLYHRSMPHDVTNRLAQPTMIPAYDWTKTRAFALPSDQNGWIRINLAGREAKGCVPLESYQETCKEIEDSLRKLTTADGRPLVRDIIYTAQSADSALSQRIPDVVVHWHDAAFELPMSIDGLLLEAHKAAVGQTGQHAHEGFLIFKGSKELCAETLHATELHKIINTALADD